MENSVYSIFWGDDVVIITKNRFFHKICENRSVRCGLGGQNGGFSRHNPGVSLLHLCSILPTHSYLLLFDYSSSVSSPHLNFTFLSSPFLPSLPFVARHWNLHIFFAHSVGGSGRFFFGFYIERSVGHPHAPFTRMSDRDVDETQTH